MDIFEKYNSLDGGHKSCLDEWAKEEQEESFWNMCRIYFDDPPKSEIRKLYDYIRRRGFSS